MQHVAWDQEPKRKLDKQTQKKQKKPAPSAPKPRFPRAAKKLGQAA